MQHRRSILPKPLCILLVFALFSALVAPGAHAFPAPLAVAPSDPYLFVELWLQVDGSGTLPRLCIDFPGYQFNPSTGVLEPFFGSLPQLQPTDLGFAGRGQSRTGAAGCGAASDLTAIASLPYTTTIAVGTGETTEYGATTRAAPVVLESVDQDGTLSATIDGEHVTLTAGAQWLNVAEADLVNNQFNGHYILTSWITNYGWQSRARIVGQQQRIWLPIVAR